MPLDPYSTHLPVLENVLRTRIVRTAVEDGGGKYSTPVLLRYGTKLVTVEEDSEWTSTILAANSHVDADQWKVQAQWDPQFGGSVPDLVFIDGPRHTRWRRANDAFAAGVPTVVIHDTELVEWYGWDNLKPDGYAVNHDHNNKYAKRTSVYQRMGGAPDAPPEPAGRVVASLATLSDRWEYLGAVLYHILPAVNALYIYSDEGLPLPKHIAENPKVIRVDREPGLGDTGKFLFLEYENDPVYAIVLDDDLYYPARYVEDMLRWVRLYSGRAIVGVAGAILGSPCTSYYKDGRLAHYHYTRRIISPIAVNLTNTGQIAFHTKHVRPPLSAFEVKNMTDVWLARWANANKIPQVIVSHEPDYIRHAPVDLSKTIYAEHVQNDATETQIVNSALWTVHPIPFST